MRHLFKQQSIQSLGQYNKWLLGICAMLSGAVLVLILALINKEQIWLLIPSIDTERRMTISSTRFQESYLQEWARGIVKTLYTVSDHDIDHTIAEIRIISASTTGLNAFFKKHTEFVRGSKITSNFAFKKAAMEGDSVRVDGTFQYWFEGSATKVSVEKSLLLSYVRTSNGLCLLTNILEMERTENE